jgi:hypothetical protein
MESLSALGARLEQAAQRDQRAESLSIVEELSWYLEHVHVVYRRPAAAHAS